MLRSASDGASSDDMVSLYSFFYLLGFLAASYRIFGTRQCCYYKNINFQTPAAGSSITLLLSCWLVYTILGAHSRKLYLFQCLHNQSQPIIECIHMIYKIALIPIVLPS